MKDFTTFIYYIARRDVVTHKHGFNLLSPWLVEGDECDDRKWRSVNLLLNVHQKSRSDAQAVPYVLLDGGNKSYVNVQLTDLKTFPQNAFTYSVWVKLHGTGSVLDTHGDCIPLLSLCGPTSCFLEVHWEVRTRLIRVGVCKRGLTSVIQFQLPVGMNVDLYAWNLIVVSAHQKKVVIKGTERSSKSAICLFFNGLPCQPVGAHLIAVEMPIGLMNMNVGRLLMDFNGAEDEGTKEIIKIQTLRQPPWQVGPIVLWDDSLSVTQLSLVFLKGPSYTGTFQAESPLSDYLASASCELLSRCDKSGIPITEYMKELGLQGLESVVDPPVEHVSTLVSSYDLPVLPPAYLAYSAEASGIIYTVPSGINLPGSRPQSPKGLDELKSSEDTSNRLKNVSMQSCRLYMGLSSLPTADILSGQVFQPSTLAVCVSALGGPSILFPLIQAAQSQENLIAALRLIRYSVKGSSSNLKFMQIKGYKILGFLLSLKNKDLISAVLMDELFEFCVSRSQERKCSYSLLLVDTPALYYLLLNHQIWGLKRYPYASKVVDYLNSLSSDSTHGDLNNKRLAALGE